MQEINPWSGTTASRFWQPVLDPQEPTPVCNRYPVYGEAPIATNIPIPPKMLDMNYQPQQLVEVLPDPAILMLALSKVRTQ